MKLRSRTAVALACIFALAPLTACNQTNKADTESEAQIVMPALPPQETLPEEPLPPTPEEPQEQPEENEPTVTVIPSVAEEPKAKTSDYILIQSDNLNIRTGAGTNYAVLGSADKGSLLVYIGSTGGWYETRYQNRTAYVNASHATLYKVTLTDNSDRTEAVIRRGFDFLGVKYVYGATRYHDGKGNKLNGFTTEAFDCSSYMQYIFYHGAGVLLNMTTRTQVTQGVEVAKKDIQRGDLLFFTNASRYNNTGVERVGHVALYLGDNYILHTASDYARAEQITPARWNYYLTARRVL